MTNLMEEVNKNTELADVFKEIDNLNKIRNRLEASYQQKSVEEARSRAKRMREKLRSKFEGGFRTVDDFSVLQAAEEIFLELYPTEDYGLDQAREDRNLSKEIAAMFERYQKIIKGTTIQIEFTSAHYDKLLGYVFSCCCATCQNRLSERLAKDAQKSAEKKVISL